MKLKNFVILLILAMAFFYAQSLWAGNIQMITYYPAPEGAYDRFTLTPQTTLPATCTVGSLMVEASTGILKYCHDISGVGTWGPISNVWTESGDNVYPTNTIPTNLTPTTVIYSNVIGDICNPDPRCQVCVPPKNGACLDVMPPNWCYCDGSEGEIFYDKIFMGIGTSTPSFKLTLENDGGIIALGNFGSGALLNLDIPSPAIESPRFIWYPRKAAFRAGIDSAGGPTDDSAIGDYSVTFGKFSVASGLASVGSGQNNTVNGKYAVAAGGSENSSPGDYATITGGRYNFAPGHYSTISGIENIVETAYSTIGGGLTNTIASTYAMIGGGNANSIAGLGVYAAIAGGKENSSSSQYGVIAGGTLNQTYGGDYPTIGGGQGNILVGNYAYVGGGAGNYNANASIGDYAVIGGGVANKAQGAYSVITGGSLNDAKNAYSTIICGWSNIASGDYSVVTGGSRNIASGTYSVVAGGASNTAAGDYSFAAGRYMNLSNAADRTFVWGYSDTAISITTPDAFIIPPGMGSGGSVWNPKLSIGELNPTAVLNITETSGDYLAITSTSVATPGNIFIVKANNNVGIGKSNPAYPLEFGPQANGAYLTAGGVWTSTCSREYKTNIQPLETNQAIDTVMNLNPVIYNYKNNKKEHHVGFIAEDVPDLVAEEGRKGLDAMNVTAVLTSVLKDQKKTIQVQGEVLNDLETELQSLKAALQKR